MGVNVSIWNELEEYFDIQFVDSDCISDDTACCFCHQTYLEVDLCGLETTDGIEYLCLDCMEQIKNVNKYQQ